jgi:hypothetical protein
MAKQPYFVNTSQKQMDVQGSFGGGMVSQAHPEKIRDDQAVLIENGDIIAGGVIQARGAYSQTNNPSSSISGNTQGWFKYQNLAGGQDMVAINGNLYTVSGNTYTRLNITGLPSGFQTSRPIEAVQYRDKMYFATGSGIVVYDGVNASLLNAYAPNGLEALYIGTNGYAANPDNYLSDTTGAADVILGVTASSRYGVINTPVTFTAYVQKIPADTLEYKFEIKQVVSADYPTTPAQDWSTNKTFTTTFTTKADYMVRVSLRKQGTTTVLSQYILPRYKVGATPDENPEQGVNFSNLSTCNRILVHYDRLMIYGDTTYPDNLYISHLNNFAYFPRTNIIKVTDPLRGGLQAVKQYRTYLIFFTNGSIQMMTGTSPADYVKTNVNTSLGTPFPYSIQVLQNYLIFVGSDYGVYILQQVRATSLMMNVHRIDNDIRDAIGGYLKTSTRVLSCVYNNQYYMYIENSGANYIYRYYYDMQIWVRDNIGTLQFSSFNCLNNVVYATSLTGGTIYKLLQNVFKDGTNLTYNLKVTSKDYDFGMPHHRKKLKQYQILAKMTNLTTITVDIYLDNNLLSTTNLQYDPNQNTDAQKLKVMASGRFRYVKTNLTIPVNELVQLIGFTFVYKLNTPK